MNTRGQFDLRGEIAMVTGASSGLGGKFGVLFLCVLIYIRPKLLISFHINDMTAENCTKARLSPYTICLPFHPLYPRPTLKLRMVFPF